MSDATAGIERNAFCLIDNVIYKATIGKVEVDNDNNDNGERIYIGAAEVNWKNKMHNYFINRK